jgi:hypothetical protein
MDVLLIDGFLHNFPHTEGSIPAGIKILRCDMERPLLSSPSLHILNLNKRGCYHLVLLGLCNVDNVSEGGDNIDIDTST